MIGTISAIASLASAVMSGISAARQAKANNTAYNDKMSALNSEKNRLDALRNADATELADYKAFLTKGGDTLRRQNRAIESSNAVLGGSNAAVAAQKDSANQSYATMVSKAAADAAQYKQHLDDKRGNLLSNENSLIDQRLAGTTEANKLAVDATEKAGEAMQKFGSAYDKWKANNTEQ